MLFVCVIFHFYFLQLYCPIGCFPRGNPAATTYCACWVFWCFHNPPNSHVDYMIFNVSTDMNACDCTRGCTDTVRESALKVDSGRKIPCRNGESNLHSAACRSDALPTEPHPRLIQTESRKNLSVIICSRNSSTNVSFSACVI